jgi:hypothetical protein
MAATATSVGLAVGLTRAVPRLPVSIGTKAVLSKLVPFVSVASAGVVNICCIRWKEMQDGIQVFRLKHDADGNEETEVLGKSSKAGKLAVGQSAASRVLTNIPTLIIPPVVMTILEKRGAFMGPRGKLLGTATQLTLSESLCSVLVVSKAKTLFHSQSDCLLVCSCPRPSAISLNVRRSTLRSSKGRITNTKERSCTLTRGCNRSLHCI